MRTQKADRFRSAPHYQNSPFWSLLRDRVRRSELTENTQRHLVLIVTLLQGLTTRNHKLANHGSRAPITTHDSLNTALPTIH